MDEEREVMAVLGAGFKSKSESFKNRQDLSLSPVSKMRVLGAITMLENGYTPEEIVFSGGHTNGDDWISEAAGMKTYGLRHARVPSVRALLNRARIEEDSKDSSSNAENTAPLIGSRRGRIFTSLLHGLRAGRLFRAYGVSTVNSSAEDHFKQRSEHHRRLLANTTTLAGIINSLKVEIPLNILLFVDPKGLIPRGLSAKRGLEDK